MTEEMYDVLNEKGNKIGQALPKSEVHEKELRHASVFIWIYNSKGEVLLQFRSLDKKSFPGVWDVSVAGHISAGDTPIDTAVREIEEEVGIKVSADELVQVEFVSDVVPWLPDKKHPEFCWVYILHKELDPNALTIQEKELTAIKLQSIDSIQAARSQPNSQKVFAARNPRVYNAAFNEIKKRLNNNEKHL